MKPLPEGEGDGPWLQTGRGEGHGAEGAASIFNVAKVSSRTDLWVSWKYQKNEAAKDVRLCTGLEKKAPGT